MKKIIFIFATIVLTSCLSQIGNNAKDTTVIITTWRGVVDTFKIKACEIWLYQGDVHYKNDTDEWHGNYHTLASGVYKFKTIK